MYEVEIFASFAAAHRLTNYKGKCEHLHGHNYKVQVKIRAKAPGPGGMVMDFGHLKKVANLVLDRLDHKYLNEIPPFDSLDPSAENIAAYLYEQIERNLGKNGKLLHSVTVWESDNSRATYFRDE
jgi:6-pyruvoyltetrahydropterin/6-carboxytetrahydropterin synthase